MFELEDTTMDNFAKITVVGVGGGGIDAVNNMIEQGLENVGFIAIDSDAETLLKSAAPKRVQIGAKKGTNDHHPETSEGLAEESREDILEALRGADMVFVVAGLYGGTGSGAATVVAGCARELGALTVALVTEAFHIKEKDAVSKAASVIDKLKEQADAVITVSRQCLWEINGQDTSIEEAVRAADNIFYQIVKGIGDIIGQSGSVNLDFADVKSILANSGTAFIGFGEAAGEKASLAAVKAAIESPLLKGLKGARAILMNIVGSSRSIGGMVEVNEATTAIQELAHQDAEIIWGVTTDEAMGEKASVIVIATKLAEDSDEVEV